MTTCTTCSHDRVMHPRGLACRMCACQAFVAPEPSAEDPGHRHAWQPAGVLAPFQGFDQIAALCPCGAVARLRIPTETSNA